MSRIQSKNDLIQQYDLKSLSTEIVSIISGIDGWDGYNTRDHRVHLAIFQEPYLSLIFEGKKRIESRFSKNKIIPYENVSTGDILLLKKSSGDVEGICSVKKVWFFKIDAIVIKRIKTEFCEFLCIDDPVFWEKVENSSYGTLMELEKVTRIVPFVVKKKDRRPWVMIKDIARKTLFEFTRV